MSATTAAPPTAPTGTEREPDIEPGWYPDMSMGDYLALPYMSASRLETFRRSPMHYRHAVDHPDDPSSRAMDMGTALHLAILEPEKFEGRYVTVGRCEGTKGDGERCQYQGSVYRDGFSFCGTHDPMKGEPVDPDIHVLAKPDLESVKRMRDAVLAHPRARTFFEGEIQTEVTGIAADPDTGVLCKIRPDVRVVRAPVLPDVKSTKDASPWAFAKDAANRGYHRKLALYRRIHGVLDGERLDPAIIAVENTAPHGVAVYLLDDDDIREADREVRRHLSRFAWCQEEDIWPGYGDEFRYLKLPGWAFDGDMEEADDE